MGKQEKIIRHLQSGRSSANGIASRLKVPEETCQEILDRLVVEEVVLSEVIDCGITVYRLNR